MRAEVRWTGSALTLVGIWYGVLVAVFGVLAAVASGPWPVIYAVASIALGVVIFGPLKRVTAIYMQRYVDRVSVSVSKTPKDERNQ